MQLFSICFIQLQTNKQTNKQASKQTRGVSHYGLAIYLKSILRQKKNDGNSNISPCKNIIFKTSSGRNPKSIKILERYNESISSLNTSQNISFQKSSYKNRPILYIKSSSLCVRPMTFRGRTGLSVRRRSAAEPSVRRSAAESALEVLSVGFQDLDRQRDRFFFFFFFFFWPSPAGDLRAAFSVA